VDVALVETMLTAGGTKRRDVLIGERFGLTALRRPAEELETFQAKLRRVVWSVVQSAGRRYVSADFHGWRNYLSTSSLWTMREEGTKSHVI
jgi:hypothetical protein